MYSHTARLARLTFLVFAILGAAGTSVGQSIGAWTWVSPAPQWPMKSITWGNGEFIGASWNGLVFRSTDARTWKRSSTGIPEHLWGVAWNGSRYVVAGGRWVATSADGSTWTSERLPDPQTALAVTWAGDKFVVVGRDFALTSRDGLAWNAHATGPHALSSVVWNGTAVVAVGSEGAIFTSPDGEVWSERASLGAEWLAGVTWGISGFVAVGWNGSILVSPDGETWSRVRSASGRQLNGVAWNGATYVAVGDQLLTSPDGATWTELVPPGAPQFGGYGLETIAWNGKMFLAVGAMFVSSQDGAAWERQDFALNAVASSGDLAVAVGDRGAVLTSPDGAAWTQQAPATDSNLRAIVWNGEQFFAAAADGTVARSSDGLAWHSSSTGLGSSFSRLAWGGARFVAVLDDGGAASSTNGTTWTRVTTGGSKLSDVVATGREFVAVGERGTVRTSADGVTWSMRSAPTDRDLRAVTWSGAEFVAVGSAGTVVTSPDGTVWSLRAFWWPPCGGPDCEEVPDLRGVYHDGRGFLLWGDTYWARRTLRSPDAIGWLMDDALGLAAASSTGAVRHHAHLVVVQGRQIWRAPLLPLAVVVPAAAHLTGINGTLWRTDLDVLNVGAGTARYSLEMLPRTGSAHAPPVRFTLAPATSARLRDVVQSVFGATGAGALRITPLAGDLRVSSRTYNDAATGTAGQFVPAFSAEHTIHAGTTTTLIQLSQSASRGQGFRTNVGLVNVGEAPITVEIRLYASSGARLGVVTVSTPPDEVAQIDEIFRRVTADEVPDGYAELRTMTPGGAFVAYASVIDNRSGDAVCIPAR